MDMRLDELADTITAELNYLAPMRGKPISPDAPPRESIEARTLAIFASDADHV